jgi:putative PIN family toxin of toxin-antitoxin system
MKIVLDTNVVISGFLFNGPPADILAAGPTENVEFFSSEPLLQELSRILKKKKLANRMHETEYTPEIIMAKYRRIVEIVLPVEFLEPQIVRDPDDEMVLSAAYSANADMIVSGDEDLLVLTTFSNIRIISPAECMTLFRAKKDMK